MTKNERWHINCYWKGTTELADAQAFQIRGQAEDRLKQLLDTDAQSIQQSNAHWMGEQVEQLREFVLDLDAEAIYEMGASLKPIMPLTDIYDYKVERCEETLCVACYEAGLIDFGNVPMG